MFTYLRIIQEGILYVWNEFLVNKSRTFLTLLGISIGIFCVITVFSVVDSLKKNIQSSIDELGSNILFVEKWPWGFGSDYPWWKYLKRPVPTLEEMEEIQNRVLTASTVVFNASTSTTIEKDEVKVSDISLLGTTKDYPEVMKFDIELGRYVTENEFVSGSPVCVIGWKIAQNFGSPDKTIGEYCKLFNQKVKIIGVFKSEGTSNLGNNHDNIVLVPVNFFRRFIDLRQENNTRTSIAIKVKQGISVEQSKDEITGIMRSIRKLKPKTEENFAINETSLLTEGFENLFSIVSIAGWLIGSFSLLVGGFGIANIMFVSVRERTRIIGIQKAIGAKRHIILTQFLIESVFLSIAGGIFGLLIVISLVKIVSISIGFPLYVSVNNILIAVSISALIGILSGLAPAWIASKLDPVEAIRK